MKVSLPPSPWCISKANAQLEEAVQLLEDGIWREAAIDFYALRTARQRNGKMGARGMQGSLNRVISARFAAAGWTGLDGRFVKERTWIRVTFRHQMSLGTDILESVKVCVKEGYRQVAIFAGAADWLQVVSPNDHRALVSFEKLRLAIADLDGVVAPPLFIGALRGSDDLPLGIQKEIMLLRPRSKRL